MYRRSVPKIGIIFCVCLLVIVEIFALFLMYKSSNNKNANLATVDLKGNIVNNDMFAIMLEQDDGTYKEDKSNTWPTDGYTYNESMSGCIDINGNKLDGVLTYDSTNNIATVDTGKTSYCYLYFSIKVNYICERGTTLGMCLMENPTTGLTTTSQEGGLYRYQGIQGEVNNYICFGTSNKKDCTNNTDKYMYRIIGIDSNNQVKLIKKEALESTLMWHSEDGDEYSELFWKDSDLYKGLNGIPGGYYSDLFVNNSNYNLSDNGSWYSKISSVDWKYGSNTNRNITALEMYNIENSFTSSVNAKIGLMYAYDYYYGIKGGVNCSSSGDYETCANSWIYSTKNSSEFLLTKYGWDSNGDTYTVLAINSQGMVLKGQVSSPLDIRPVFYIINTSTYKSGLGTIEIHS